MKRLVLALGISLGTASTALAGPPWLTVEFGPGNFTGVLLVRSYHHGTPLAMPLTGTAEGLVNGQRRSVPLSFALSASPNVYSVSNTWGAEGVWVLNISAKGDELGAGVVVGLDRNGDPAFTRFPRTAVGASRPATSRETDAMLKALDAGAAPPALRQTGWSAIAFRTVLPILVLIAVMLGVARAGSALVAGIRRRSAARAAV